MTIYVIWECYFMHDGRFKKQLRKLFDSVDKADEFMNEYDTSLLQWCECEERNLE